MPATGLGQSRRISGPRGESASALIAPALTRSSSPARGPKENVGPMPPSAPAIRVAVRAPASRVRSPRGEHADTERRFGKTNYPFFRERNQCNAEGVLDAHSVANQHGRHVVMTASTPQLEMSHPLTYQIRSAGVVELADHTALRSRSSVRPSPAPTKGIPQCRPIS